MGLAQLW